MDKPQIPDKGEKFRILIAEDDMNIGRLMMLNLTSAGFACQHAADGLKGLEMFRMTDPHLVLTDIMMPGMSGRDLCAKIRETSTIPIIMMTALDGESDQMAGFKVGADDYVPKPFNPKVLVARVVSQLRRVYRYDFSDDKTKDDDSKTPLGWATCTACGYMGPRERFAVTKDENHHTMCPVCKRTEFISFEVRTP